MMQSTDLHRPHRQGFTLLELLVGLSILGVVSTIGVTTFSSMTSHWHDTRTLMELDAMADAALRSMQRDFSDVIASDIGGAAVIGKHRNTEDPKHVDRVLADDLIVLPLQTSGSGRGRLVGASSMYSVARNEGREMLVRTLGPLGAKRPSGGSQFIVEDANVIRFRVEYRDRVGKADWLPEWDKDYQPAAVRVSLALEDLNRRDLQVARKAVFPIAVR